MTHDTAYSPGASCRELLVETTDSVPEVTGDGR